MSTKVYNGYRLPRGIHINQLPAWAQRLSGHLAPLRQDAIDRTLFSIALEAFDLRWLKAQGICRDPASQPVYTDTAWDASMAQANRWLEDIAQQRRVPALDIEVSARIHFRPSRPGNLYLRLFCEHPGMRNEAIQAGGLRNFAYWDNTDPPEDIPEASFNRRGLVWNSLAGAGSQQHPQAVALDLTLLSPPCQADLEASALCRPGFDIPSAWYPDFERRVMDRALASLPPSALPQEVQDDLGQGRFGSYVRYTSMLRRGEDAGFNAYRERVAQALPQAIAPSWLSMDVQALSQFGQRPRKSPSP